MTEDLAPISERNKTWRVVKAQFEGFFGEVKSNGQWRRLGVWYQKDDAQRGARKAAFIIQNREEQPR